MRKIKFILRDLAKSTNGTITPIFGLCLVTVMIVSGIAVDSARGYRLSTEAGVALDAAALAAAKALRLEALDDAELEQLATDYFDANFNIDTIGTVSEKRVHIGADRRTNTVTLRVDMKMPTTLAAVTGTKTLDVSKTATAVYDVRNVELSMMLDVSGSMSGSKLSDLKSSAGDLVNILLESNANGSDHKIAVAPFSTAVNAGVYQSQCARAPLSRCRHDMCHRSVGCQRLLRRRSSERHVCHALRLVSDEPGDAAHRGSRRYYRSYRRHAGRRHDCGTPGHCLGLVFADSRMGQNLALR